MTTKRTHRVPAQSARKPAARKPVRPLTPPVDMTQVRAIPEWVDITDVRPYPFNARDNRKAVASVAASIQQFGFLVPIVIDDEGNLAAGHTRIEAAKSLGMTEVLALRASHLTTEQIDAFRLVDNKVSELADWDIDLLAPELSRLSDLGFNFTSFGWSQDEIDCMSSVVGADCLSVDDLMPTTEAEAEQGQEGRLSTRRGPTTTRLVLGELVVFVPTQNYRGWIDGLQRLHNFNKNDIEAEILNRLGILQ